ncbi:MAG: NAD(P)/FAD-dependent oxidoreductase [Acidimicrobiia bacterium]
MSAGLPDRSGIVVVGGGLAGLACARLLCAAGRDVLVVEAADGIGGRVRTDVVDGFRLDRGFQILLTEYPELRRQLDVHRLQLRKFEPGAYVWRDGRGHELVDPLRRPLAGVSSLAEPFVSMVDKARLARLMLRMRRMPVREMLRAPETSTEVALRESGFSDGVIERFWRPLFAGIQLDPSLSTSSRMFETILRCLVMGDAAVPADGMGAIPAQLAEGIPPDRIVLDCRVECLEGHTVRTSKGTVEAGLVVVATDGPTASKLIDLKPVQSRSVTGVWYAADVPPVRTKAIVLDGTSQGPVFNVAIMSEVAPEYAPAGQTLLVAAAPGVCDAAIEPAVRAQLRRWWGPQVDDWRHLRTDAIEHGQPAQDPPFVPKRRVHLAGGLFVCGDHRDTASIQGALYSGRRCAEAVLTTSV